MTPAAHAFVEACIDGDEWDILVSLALDLDNDDIRSLTNPMLARIVRAMGDLYDPYTWRTIQPQIDKETASLREGVRDHYAWRKPFLH